MKKNLFICILWMLVAYGSHAQVNPYGVVDSAELTLSSCDFEKDANAEVLFEDSELKTGNASASITRHIRIKIFNDNGKDWADVPITFAKASYKANLSDIKAETINLENGRLQFIPVDPATIHMIQVDKDTKRIAISFPQVKPGSILEYVYRLKVDFGAGFPDWMFQREIPVNYCRLTAYILKDYEYNMIPRIFSPYKTKSTELWMNQDDTLGHKFTWALEHVKAYHDEPFSTGEADNMQRIDFILSAIRWTAHAGMTPLQKSWELMGRDALHDGSFGSQLQKRLACDSLLAAVKKITDTTEKIRYIFNYVKSKVTWNGQNKWYTVNGISKAWADKTGNSTEINLILYQFLRQTGIRCFPELVSTRDNGRVVKNYTDLNQFNKTVIATTINNTGLILDASDKYGNYRDIPLDIANTTALTIDPGHLIFDLSDIPLASSRQVTFVNGHITPDGRLEGTVQTNNYGYYRSAYLSFYDKEGEKEYINDKRRGDNSLVIDSLGRQNVENDTLPLTETMHFRLDLNNQDDNYIFINTNHFTGFEQNIFVGTERHFDIDFGYLDHHMIDGRYEIPEHYQVMSVPQNTSLTTPDKTMVFQRLAEVQGNTVVVHYAINFRKAVYRPDEYPEVHDFFKKIFELLNEPVVLKKM